MPEFQDPRRWATYGGTVGGGVYSPTNPAFPPTATAPPTYPGLHPAITGLLTPGLVPDIARQSAEVAAGRGVGGSPAGASTAVRMSEQNYLQRLALAGSLMGGEAERLLPYQITPYQSAGLQTQRDIAGAHYGGGGGQGYGGGGRPTVGAAPDFMSQPWGPGPDQSYRGTMPIDAPYTGSGINWGPQASSKSSWMQPQGPELGLWANQGPEIGLWGNQGPTLDDIKNDLGIGGGDFGGDAVDLGDFYE